MVSKDFENGASWITSEKNYDRYIRNKSTVGRLDGQFVAPSNQIDELMKKYPNQPREWEKALGVNQGSFGENPYRINIYEPANFNLREPNSSMSGANDKFVPGGKTIGGVDEGVINPVPNPEYNSNIGNIQRALDFYKSNNATANSDNSPFKTGTDLYIYPTRGSPDIDVFRKEGDNSHISPDSVFAGHSSFNKDAPINTDHTNLIGNKK